MKTTKVEKRAIALCDAIRRHSGPFTITVEWKRSATWGLCPSIHYGDGKAAHASGCGYDKLSAALAEALSPLAKEIGYTSGAGVTAVAAACRAAGWELKHVASSPTVDVFTIEAATPTVES